MARTSASYNRPGPKDEPFEKVLIVCEGKKTEPYYLNGLKREFSLQSITVDHIGNTDPLGIARHTLEVLKGSDVWQRAYCVFDGDRLEHLAEAVGLLKNAPLGRAGKLHAIVSTPCFEFWILLHFDYSSKGYSRAGKSPCAALIEALEKYLPKYAKGDANVYSKVSDHLDKAITHGKRLVREQAETGSDNPATRMHELVEYLINLKKRPQ